VTARPLAPGDCIELAVLERSGMVESRHLGAAVLVDASGEALRSFGDPTAHIYPRSTLKPLQALAVLRSGVRLRGEQLALATASHAGTDEHVRVVRDILALGDIREGALGCPADWPGDAATRRSLAAQGGGPSPIRMNCSGKHAAFLLACAHNGWPLDSYLNPRHPLQQAILEVVNDLTGQPVVHSGVDGCGAPVHAVSLLGLARAMGQIGRAGETDTAALRSAFLGHAWAIDGVGRANTVAIETLGIIAKLGAEGVMVMATGDGSAVAVKILDGSLRAATLVALEILVAAGLVPRGGADAVLDATLERVLGAGVPVGAIRPAF
jgi:L-asparaginase II